MFLQRLLAAEVALLLCCDALCPAARWGRGAPHGLRPPGRRGVGLSARGSLPYADNDEGQVVRFRKQARKQRDPSPEQPKGSKDDPEWAFFDTARINVCGGDGGNGCVAFRREKGIPYGGPSGANGGRGGSVYLVCDPSLNTLGMLRRNVHHRGGDGETGQGKSRTGRSGSDTVIPVPAGTVVKDFEGRFAGELVSKGERLCVAPGGRGGRGNQAFKTPKNNAPRLAERGEPGVEHWLNVELRLVADVGFVGVPNAGKSTLLAAVTNAKPKIANYPFTTVVPNLGVCDLLDVSQPGSGLVLADIPGLLEGAHSGVGMGLAFLRHVARCRVLLHVVSGDSEDPVGDFKAINEELRLFNPVLAEKQQVVVLNKMDIPEVGTTAAEIMEEIAKEAGHSRIMNVSAATGENVRELMQRTAKLVARQPPAPSFAEAEPNLKRVKLDESDAEADMKLSLVGNRGFRFDIEADPHFPGQFRVKSARLEKMVRMTNWDYYEALARFQRVLEATGVAKALEERGAQEGDLVMIDDLDFDFSPLGSNSFIPEHLLAQDAEVEEYLDDEFDLDMFDPEEFEPIGEEFSGPDGNGLPFGVQMFEMDEEDFDDDDDDDDEEEK